MVKTNGLGQPLVVFNQTLREAGTSTLYYMPKIPALLRNFP